ncbi:MAG: nitrilase-related carbon-nitrogen hydrolase [Nitrospiraceae bacterium]
MARPPRGFARSLRAAGWRSWPGCRTLRLLLQLRRDCRAFRLGCYRKTHLFFEETLFFDPGDSGFQVWDVGGAKVGVMICFDWFYPESARTLALMGADIIAHPSNLVLPHCPDSMVTRCLENRVFSITANRIGRARLGAARID